MRVHIKPGAFQASHLFLAIVVAALLCLASIVGAFADVAATVPVDSTIDLAPYIRGLIDFAIVVLGPALALALSGILLRLFQLLGIQLTAARQRKLRDAVDQALTQAANFARRRAGPIGPLTVDLGHAAIKAGAEYAFESIPDTLKDLGITDAASGRLSRMVEARLGAGPIDLSASTTGDLTASLPPAV